MMEEDDDSNDSEFRSETSGVDQEVLPNKLESKILPLSLKRKREVDEEWEEMNRLDEQQTLEKMSKSLHFKRTSAKEIKINSELMDMLKTIFGSSHQFMFKTLGRSSSAREPTHAVTGRPTKRARVTREQIQSAVSKVVRTEKVVETVKFAGQEIT
jgi:Fe2+ transport system protein B